MIFDKKLKISLDKSSKREMIGDRLYIYDCILTSATVNEYLGREIGDATLDSGSRYGILRPLEELEKALKSYNGIVVTHEHPQAGIDYTNEAHKHLIMGTVGTNASIKGKDLVNDVILYDKELIRLVQLPDNDKQKIRDLSVGYSHELEKKQGTYEGKQYDFVMRNLVANHLAVVDDGRVDKAMLSDNNSIKEVNKPMKKSALEHFFAWFNDRKSMDNHGYAKGIMEIANKDSGEFEGGEIEQAKAIIQMAKKIKASEEVEKADSKKEDSDEEEEKKEDKKKAKDNEEEEKAKKEANDKAIQEGIKQGIQERLKVEKLCGKVIGNISESVLLDSTPEELINKTLDSKKVDYKDKTYDAKITMLEMLAYNKTNIINDSISLKASNVKNNYIKIF